jgi:glycosyltransferase involved in cell wall biosynthesis
MRLGFHYHVPATVSEGRIQLPGSLGRFVDSLGRCCEEVIYFCHTPMPDEMVLMDYTIASANVRLVEIGPHASVLRRLASAARFTRPLREGWRDLDALLIRGPSPLLPAMARAAGTLPIALLLVGDYVAGVNDLPQPAWRREAIRLWSIWNERQQTQMAKRSLTFVNSRELYDRLSPIVPHLIETRTTTLHGTEFFEREDTCSSAPVRLLYTGRLDRGKGLLDMVEALALLVGEGEDTILDIVGGVEKGDNVSVELMTLAGEWGVADRIKLHGHKALGPELFTHYEAADIYVIASRSSEGFPRSIWEAMAFGLPVVATSVGSIPHFLQDGETALLVPSRDPLQLARAVRRLIHGASLRRKLIRCGSALARENTLERRTAELVTEIGKWLTEENSRGVRGDC